MSDKRIDEAIIKLNEAEKRYLNDNKNIDDLKRYGELIQNYFSYTMMVL
ncbi:hypothetical protein [Campylobacter ureolyticus]|nr:hypothetical protein [Campylobacter ureolyticus]MDU7070427.1 hypothetical protein [Campylobacter ureolyticus]